MDVGLIVSFAVIGFMIFVAVLELVRLSSARGAGSDTKRPAVSTFRLSLLAALGVAFALYFYGRYQAHAAREREITECMHGRSAARAMCEEFIELRHRYD